MALKFNDCCFCIELRKGCLIIGYLNLFVDVVYIHNSILVLVEGGFGAKAQDDETQISSAVTAILLVLLVMSLIVTTFLLLGLHLDHRVAVKAYLIYTWIFIVLIIISFIENIFSDNINLRVISHELTAILVSIYFLLVNRSYYLETANPTSREVAYI